MTAINWLIKELNLEGYDYTIEQAKQMERQQIIDAFKFGEYPPPFFYYNAEQYYDETYGSKGSDETKGGELATFNTSSKTEISDEELEKLVELQYPYNQLTSTELKGIIVSSERAAWIDGIKWYREQLKSK